MDHTPLTIDVFVTADYASRDQSGKFSIAGIFDVLNFPDLPAGLGYGVIVVQARGPKGQYRISIDITDPEGYSIWPKDREPKDVTIQIDNNSFVVFSPLGGIAFQKYGDYKVLFNIDDETIGIRYLHVHPSGGEGK